MLKVHAFNNQEVKPKSLMVDRMTGEAVVGGACGPAPLPPSPLLASPSLLLPACLPASLPGEAPGPPEWRQLSCRADGFITSHSVSPRPQSSSSFTRCPRSTRAHASPRCAAPRPPALKDLHRPGRQRTEPYWMHRIQALPRPGCRRGRPLLGTSFNPRLDPCPHPFSFFLWPPAQVYVTNEEVRAIKGVGQRGMTLLGFKPTRCARCIMWRMQVGGCREGTRAGGAPLRLLRPSASSSPACIVCHRPSRSSHCSSCSCLKDHHQIRNCSFLYPGAHSPSALPCLFKPWWQLWRLPLPHPLPPDVRSALLPAPLCPRAPPCPPRRRRPHAAGQRHRLHLAAPGDEGGEACFSHHAAFFFWHRMSSSLPGDAEGELWAPQLPLNPPPPHAACSLSLCRAALYPPTFFSPVFCVW